MHVKEHFLQIMNKVQTVFYRSKNAFQLFIGTTIKGKVGKGISSNSLFTLISMPRNAAGGDQLVTGEAPK